METKSYKVEQITINHDKKRKPLSSKQRAGMQGKYRYFGAQSVIDYVNDYLFDGEYLLIAEDGENLKSKKQNISQIVEGQFWLNNHAHIVQTNNLCNIRYLGYWLNTADISGYITGSAQPKLSQTNLNAIEIELPKRDIQDKIVDILNTFDKKIEMNEAINRNLSEQLKALFAKMFPNISSNGDSKLEELIQFSNGKKRPGAEGNIPVYGGNGVLSYTDKSNAENCVIVGRVGAYCGSLYLSIEQCWISDNAIMAKDKNRNSQLFIYYLLQILCLSSRHIGTSQPLLTQGILNAITIEIPEEELIIKFCDVADVIQKQIDKNTLENKRLRELRDSILPKLMSGELDVSGLEI